MSGASTLSKKDLFRLHLREVEYDFNNLADILDSVLEGREEFLAQMSEENAALRELVRKYGEYTDQDRCEGCACKSRCNDGDVDECWQLTEIRELARELGVGVDE